MSFWVPERRPAPELLDADVPATEARASLADIEWVHNRLGGRVLVRQRLLPLLQELSHGGSSLTLLDTGCGSGHVARDVAAAAAGRGLAVHVLGLDRKLAHARLAGRGTTIAADALRLPVRSRSVDVVLSTLFLHHFTPAEVSALLSESLRVARQAVVAFDLARHRLPLALVSVLGPLVFRSRLSVEDGKTSVRQAYTQREITALAAAVLPGARVARVGAFVWELAWRRP